MGKLDFPTADGLVQPQAESVMLQKLLVGVAARAAASLRPLHRDVALAQAELAHYHSRTLDHMVYELQTWLLKSSHSEMRTLTVSTPKTWFDHLKHDMLASGNRALVFIASKFRPPEYVSESKQVEALIRVCPHNNSYFPDDRKHIEFLLWKTE